MSQRSKGRCRKVLRILKGTNKEKEFCNLPLNSNGECPDHGKDTK